ncbi:MAG: hypothetical protein H0U70_09200 [Tatlockia sp.]|nr:hypothetical protein [Tatlockia sp.]
MKKIVGLLALSLAALTTQAVATQKLALDKVVFQVSAKQWVSTQSALLSVTINMTLANADLVKARADIMKNLTSLATGDWQLTQFDRSQDSSGLEKLYVAAQSRVLQANLTDIYNNAKKVSKPGATYEISGVEFKPSLDELQQTKSQLRERLYQQINEETTRLNKVFNSQTYSLNRIYFFDGEQLVPMTKAYQPAEFKTLAVNAVAAPAPLSVSNELIMGAIVELASTRAGSSAVATH